MQDVEEGQARDAREAVAPDRELLAAVDHVDVVPGLGGPGDARIGVLVSVFEEGERAVREDDAPAEGVVRPVALDDGDPVRWIALVQQDREVEPGRPAAQDLDSHPRYLTRAPRLGRCARPPPRRTDRGRPPPPPRAR